MLGDSMSLQLDARRIQLGSLLGLIGGWNAGSVLFLKGDAVKNTVLPVLLTSALGVVSGIGIAIYSIKDGE